MKVKENIQKVGQGVALLAIYVSYIALLVLNEVGVVALG